MATMTLKNVPDELYQRLVKLADKHRRSLNNEAIVTLERGAAMPDVDIDATLERIRLNRRKLKDQGLWLTEEFIDFAKNEGRS